MFSCYGTNNVIVPEPIRPDEIKLLTDNKRNGQTTYSLSLVPQKTNNTSKMSDLSLIPIIKKIEPEGVLNRLKHFFTSWNNKKPDETNIVVLEQRILNYDYTRKLTGRELIMRLRQFPYWSGILLKRPHLRREFAFSDHRKAIIFINLVSEEALLASHYPKIINSHLHVAITLRTVEVDGISNKDFALAHAIDMVADKVGCMQN